MKDYIDITLPNELPHSEMSRIGRVIAAENLDYVNSHSKPVHPRRSFYVEHGKRTIDFCVAAVALFLTCPINLVLAVCTYIDVGLPIFFLQDRVGKDGKLFTIVKFRNMNNKKDAYGDLLPGKERVTEFGRFVRKTSLDELLNFWSVLKGDMSIIGPRPLPEGYNERFSERHKMRWAVRPGLECPFLYPSDKKITWAEQFENDVWYVENISFLTDVRLLAALIRMAVNRNSSSVRGAADRGSFMGYYKDGSSINSKRVPIKYYDLALEQYRNEKK